MKNLEAQEGQLLGPPAPPHDTAGLLTKTKTHLPFLPF